VRRACADGVTSQTVVCALLPLTGNCCTGTARDGRFGSRYIIRLPARLPPTALLHTTHASFEARMHWRVFPSPLSPASVCLAFWWNHLAAVAPAHGMLHK
jgi:hypothetical protein